MGKITNVDKLREENRQLKDRWQKLREWLSDRRSENGSKYFDNEMIEDDNILDKMKELEQGEKNDTNK